MKKEKLVTADQFGDTLTQEEKDAKSYLTWSDETLARGVRAIAHKLANTDVDGWKGVMTMAAAMTLVNTCRETNSTTFTQELEGYYEVGNPEIKTNWRITVEKLDTL